MTRSSKKFPYVPLSILKKIENSAGKTLVPIKTWSRSCLIIPKMVGLNFLVHTGRGFENIYISSERVGKKLGEFVNTRTFRSHKKSLKQDTKKRG